MVELSRADPRIRDSDPASARAQPVRPVCAQTAAASLPRPAALGRGCRWRGRLRGPSVRRHRAERLPGRAAILRSYVRSGACEVFYLADDLEAVGAVVLDEPDFDRNELCFQLRRSDGVGYRGIDYIRELTEAASKHAAQLGLPADEALQGVLLPRIGNELEADVIVTDRAWLLDLRSEPHARHLSAVMSVGEALALMALYLRWHKEPVILGGTAVQWSSAASRRSAAYAALPAFERWNQAARRTSDVSDDLELHTLVQSCLVRVARAFKFRDNIYGLYATMNDHEPEEMLCELDSLLYSLVGAFDVAAVVVDRMLGLGAARPAIGWQRSKWRKRLEVPARALHAHVDTGTEMDAVFKVLRWLRNTVHHEALDLTHDSGTFLVTLPSDAQDKLRDLFRSGVPGWDHGSLGVHVQPKAGVTTSKWLPGVGRYSVYVRRVGAPKNPDPMSGVLAIDGRAFTNKVFPAALSALNYIMSLTPVDGRRWVHEGLGHSITDESAVAVQRPDRPSPPTAVRPVRRPGPGDRRTSRHPLRSQRVIATASLNFSDGVMNASVLLGRGSMTCKG